MTINDKLKINNYSKETNNRAYLTQITKLQGYKKNILFSNLSKDFVLRYKSNMLEKLKNNPNTANKSLSMLKTFVNWGIEEKFIKDNPFDQVKITKGHL